MVVVDFIKAHWVEIGVAVFAIHTLAKAVADATETKKDDVIVAKIGAVIGYLFGVRPKKK